MTVTASRTIGHVLRTHRTGRRWSYRDLAQRSGLTPSALHKIEHGRADPTLSTLTALAAALGVGLGRFVDSIGDRASDHACPFCGGCRVSVYCCFTTCYCEDGP